MEEGTPSEAKASPLAPPAAPSYELDPMLAAEDAGSFAPLGAPSYATMPPEEARASGMPGWLMAVLFVLVVGAVVGGVGVGLGWFSGDDDDEPEKDGEEGEADARSGDDDDEPEKDGEEGEADARSDDTGVSSSSALASTLRATFFQHYDYGGLSSQLGVGRYDIGSMGIANDEISSVRVPAGLRVILYEHGGFGGATRILTRDTPNLGALGFNDKTSSIVIETPTPAQTSGSPFYIRHSSGKCVHALGGSATPANDGKMVYYDGCSGPRLQFSLTPEGSIRHHGGKCLHPLGGSATPANNTRVVFYDGCAEQRLRFELTPGGSIRHVTSGKCIRPFEGPEVPANNTELVLHDGCDEPRLSHTFVSA